MKTLSISLLSYYLLIFTHNFFLTSSASSTEESAFLQCLFHHPQHHNTISNLTYTQKNASYSSVLNITIQNLRFASPSTPKPVAIITPLYESQIPPAIYCSKKHGFQIRIRSGGHDYEGLSYVAHVPFAVIDLINLRAVDVDVKSQTAWVQSGATIRELYDKIAEKSRTLGFPAAVGTSVGIGGHFSGGGYGVMQRKYGLAADNVIDARLVDANGRILDRKSMGEDLFWAIRGGGGGSFGVVVAWKVKLVPVPEKVTVFTVQKTLEQNATEIIHRWQYIGHKFPEELVTGIFLNRANSTILASFVSLYLGGEDKLLTLMKESFPELGLDRAHCAEMSWIESVSYMVKNTPPRRHFKGKSDYVKEPIPMEAFEGIWKLLLEVKADPLMLLVPYGGKMSEIPESAIPFPHRAGNLFMVQYDVYWDEEGREAAQKHINWSRKLYKYITPYVSKNPRAAYINYRDLDIGVNNVKGRTSYAKASVWGMKYFKGNFRRLAQVKTMVDPSNIFRHEQSIPLI